MPKALNPKGSGLEQKDRDARKDTILKKCFEVTWLCHEVEVETIVKVAGKFFSFRSPNWAAPTTSDVSQAALDQCPAAGKNANRSKGYHKEKLWRLLDAHASHWCWSSSL